MKFFTMNSKDLFNPDLNPTMRFDVPFASLVKDLLDVIGNKEYTPESAMQLLGDIMTAKTPKDEMAMDDKGKYFIITHGSKLDKFMQGLTSCTNKAEAIAYSQKKLGFRELTEPQQECFISFIDNVIKFKANAAQKRLEEQQTRINGLLDLMR